MAFIDGDWGDIAELADDETVVNVTHFKDKTFEVVDPLTGLVVQ